jgi:hypothetical protein
MDEVTPGVRRLIADKTLPRSQVSAREFTFMRPLLDGGVLSCERVGRGEVLRVVHEDAFLSWVRRNFPAYENAWSAPEGAGRAQAVALRRDSKAGGSGVGKSVLHLRALNATAEVWLDDMTFPVARMTQDHGLAACLIGPDSRLKIEGRVALIENLECFLNPEAFLLNASVVLNSAGRISDRLIACLKKSHLGARPLLHAPDYDPVGLSDYLRLRAGLGPRVELWVPSDLELRFATFGNRGLIASKPRNRALLEQLGDSDMPCETSRRVFDLIKETGCGLEQESLLLGKRMKRGAI